MGSIFKSGIAYVNGGDAGKTLTWEEYQALPEAIKMNGTTYYINDIDNYSPDSFAPVIYSEEEREVGVWIDGKPIYERTFVFLNKSTPVTSWTDLTTLTGIDRIVTRKGYWQSHYNNVGNWLPVGGRYVQLNYIPSSGKLQFIATDTGNTTIDLYITLQYTKIADIPGSGSWTPQGVPAIHYSFDEHVIGTWVDESTVYEHTYDLNSNVDISPSSWYATTIDSTNIANILTAYGTSTTGSFYHLNAYPNPSTNKINLQACRSSANASVRYLVLRYTKSS